MVSTSLLRKQVLEIGRRLYENGFVAGAEGNISCRLPDNQILITPSGHSKGRLAEEDLVVIDGGGAVLGGFRKPSSEFKLHTYIYDRRNDVNAIVHAHPIYCTAFACTDTGLPTNILPEIILTVGEIPLAKYGTPSTDELPESIDNLIDDHDMILLRNHGVVAAGDTLEDACNMVETAEQYAKTIYVAKSLGGAKSLTEDAVRKLTNIRNGI